MKNKLKLIVTRLLKIIAIIVYKIICFVIPVNSKRVVFLTLRRKVIKGNLYFLHKEMVKSNPGFEYVTLARGDKVGKSQGRKYLQQLFTDYYYLATARLFIIDDYYLPLYFIRVRKGTKVIQLWHASGPLKKVGLSLKGLPDGPSEDYLKVVSIHSNYDSVIVNAYEEIDFYAEAFGMTEKKILPLGSPRTDILFKKIQDKTSRENFLIDFPQFANKELILFAPTFRGRSNDWNPYVPPIDLKMLIPELLKTNKVLIINLHPYMKENKELVNETTENAIFWNEGKYTTEELLMISDALISDYSSVIYDFAILEKPIALYCYDYAQYNRQRGFYVDIQTLLPGTYFEQESDLINWIKSDSKDSAEVIELKNKNFKHQDGQASKRIIKSIFE